MHKICENIAFENEALLFLVASTYLTPASKLRKLYEEHPTFLCVPCYDVTTPELSKFIKGFFDKHTKAIDLQLIRDLAGFFMSAPHTLESELEKILLAAGTSRDITYDHIKSILVSSRVPEAKDIIDAFLNQNKKQFVQLSKNQDSVTLITFLRSLTGSMLRLHHIKSVIEDGATIDTALGKAQPPVFFKEKNSLKTQVQLWGLEDLSQSIETARQLEVEIKKNSTAANDIVTFKLLTHISH